MSGGPLQERPDSSSDWVALNTYKGMVGWKVAPRLALKAGVSLNNTVRKEGSTFRTSENMIHESGRLQVWPAVFFGVDL